MSPLTLVCLAVVFVILVVVAVIGVAPLLKRNRRVR
jgi:hypothetical protein